MSFGGEEFDRKVLPIWDRSSLSASLGENSAIKKIVTGCSNGKLSGNLVTELRRSDEVGVAVELLSIASLENEPEAMAIAARRIATDSRLPLPVRTIANQIINGSDNFSSVEKRLTIRELRAHLSSRPRNALAWVDLAREHIIDGNRDQAHRAMTVALGLVPNHKWVTRVASRLFIHLQLVDKSHKLLTSHPAIRSDPWIASAEISVSDLLGRTSKYLSGAKKLLEANISPMHTAELASALATMELKAGAHKKAKSYFKSSLIDPNRNALAQAKWVEQAHELNPGVTVTSEQMKVAFEAKSWESYIRGDAYKAFEFSKEWYKSEPYSSKPPMLATYLAALIDKYDESIAIADSGLKTNPENSTLKLNKAYAEISKITNPNLVPEKKILYWISLFKEMMKKDKFTSSHASANMGMLCYRIGFSAHGRQWYDHAESLCRAEGRDNLLMCLIYHCREAILSNASWSEDIYQKAKIVMKEAKTHILPSGLFYMDKIEALRLAPSTWAEIIGAVNPKANNSEIFTFKDDLLESTVRFYLPESF